MVPPPAPTKWLRGFPEGVAPTRRSPGPITLDHGAAVDSHLHRDALGGGRHQLFLVVLQEERLLLGLEDLVDALEVLLHCSLQRGEGVREELVEARAA